MLGFSKSIGDRHLDSSSTIMNSFQTRIWPQRHFQSTLFVCSRITLSVSQQVPFERSNIVFFGVMAERSVRNLKQLGSAGSNAVAFLQGGLQIAALRIRHFLLKVPPFA